MNKKELKGRIAAEALVFLGVVLLLAFIIRIWPIILLALAVMLICVLRLLFLRVRTVKVVEPTPPVPEPPQTETELGIIAKAFGLLQRRITEQLELQYPGARWVWGVTNAIERFRCGEPLIIMLNRAGGYQRAQVAVHNLIFKGLYYQTAEAQPVQPAVPETPRRIEPPDPFGDGFEFDEPLPDEAPINYGRLAFDWVDANIADINTRYNESIAKNQSEMLIPSEELPHPDSWPDVCEELKRNGFTAADFCEDGIVVNIAQ